MKNVLTALFATLVLVAGFSTAQAAEPVKPRPVAVQASAFNPMHTVTCGIWIIPNRCTIAERIVGTTIVGAGIGFGVGALVGAGGYTIGGSSFLAAKGTSAVAWSGAAIGGGAGFIGSTAASYVGN